MPEERYANPVEDYDIVLPYIEKCRELAKTYRPMTLGDARLFIRPFPVPGRLDSYLTKQFIIDEFDVVQLSVGKTMFMSITPMELQSHINPIRWASGRVLVGGLGLGYYVNEIVQKPEVTEITVVEKSADVIEIYRQQFEVAPKVKLVNDDLWNHEGEYDFAYYDIWDGHTDSIPDDLEHLVEQITCERHAFWGLERFLLYKWQSTMRELTRIGWPMRWCIQDCVKLWGELKVVPEDLQARYDREVVIVEKELLL